jgi:biopolymer transport protein ExbD
LQINLPESRTAELAPAASDAPLLLEVKGETEISFDGSLVPIEELAVRVRAAREAAPERLIAMQADREAAFGVVVKVLDALKEAGVDKLPAFTQPRESSQP